MSVAGTTATNAVENSAVEQAAGSLLSRYMELTKARLSALVLFTAAVGYVMAAPSPVDWIRFIWVIIGVGLSAGAANAFNQVIEAHRDARMQRTRNRPVPSGRLSARHGFFAALAMAYVGVLSLALFVNVIAAALSLLTIVIYVLLYTPLKVRTTLNTWIGAICGALPPMIGWVAARGQLDAGAWVLGALLFVWQLPHFLALAWLYRADYERGGYRMLPSADPSGQLTGKVCVYTSLILLPTTLSAAMVGLTGWLFAIGAIGLGIWMLRLALRFARQRDETTARQAFIGSIVYLPLVLAAMLGDRAIFETAPNMIGDSAAVAAEFENHLQTSAASDASYRNE